MDALSIAEKREILDYLLLDGDLTNIIGLPVVPTLSPTSMSPSSPKVDPEILTCLRMPKSPIYSDQLNPKSI